MHRAAQPRAALCLGDGQPVIGGSRVTWTHAGSRYEPVSGWRFAEGTDPARTAFTVSYGVTLGRSPTSYEPRLPFIAVKRAAQQPCSIPDIAR